MGNNRFSERANGLFHLGGWCRIGQDGDIGAGSTLSLELCRGLCCSRGGLFRQPAGGLDGFQYAGGVVFAFLNVRLIERMNPQEVACHSRGDFPPEKFCREIVTVLERKRQDRMALSRELGDVSVERVDSDLPLISDRQRAGPCHRRSVRQSVHWPRG